MSGNIHSPKWIEEYPHQKSVFHDSSMSGNIHSSKWKSQYSESCKAAAWTQQCITSVGENVDTQCSYMCMVHIIVKATKQFASRGFNN